MSTVIKFTPPDAEKYIIPESRHSKTGPSGADRWMNCSASVQLIDQIEEKFGKDDGSEDADRGTAAHHILTRCLMASPMQDAWEHGGKIVVVGKREFAVDAEMVEGVQIALDEVRRLRAEYPNGILYVERVLSSELDPEAFGAGDIIFEVPGVAIWILDFKYGAGKTVEPTSFQMRQYGYMAYEMRGSHMQGDGNEPTKIICGVIQPRIPHPKGVIRTESYDVADVETWFFETVLPALAETRNPNAMFKMGEWCQFCPGKKRNKCPAFQRELTSVNTNIEPKTMTAEELGDTLAKFEVLLSLKERLEEEVFQRMCAGESVKNRKLVHKQSNRVFRQTIEEEVIDPQTGEVTKVVTKLEDALTAKFGMDAWTSPTLKTPPKIEELPEGGTFVSRWAYKPDAGLTIAPMSDKRTAVKPLMERYNEASAQDTAALAAAGIPI